MKGSRYLLLVLLLSVGSAPAAHAAEPGSVAPPGNSAVDQYRESVPPASSSAGKPSAGQRRALAREGQDGEDLAEVLERSGGVARDFTGGAGSGETASGADGREQGSGRDSDGNESGAAPGGSGSSSGGGSASGDSSASNGVSQGSLPVSAVSTSLGPFPIWVMMIAAAVLIAGVAIVRRGRTA